MMLDAVTTVADYRADVTAVKWSVAMNVTSFAVLVAALVTSGFIAARQASAPRQQPGAAITVYAPDQHDLYDGRFVISGIVAFLNPV